MIKEAIGTGSTVESAIEAGVAQLGVPRDMVEVQVLAMPKKAFLGMFGGNPAKVRVYMEIPDEKPVVKTQPKETEKPAPAKKPSTPAAAPRQEKPVEERKAAPKQETKPEIKTAPKVAAPVETPKVEEVAQAPAKEKAAPVDLNSKGVPVTPGSKGDIARAFLEDVIKAMDIGDVKVEASMQGETAVLRLVGESNGLIIGKRGETLDALQYLSSLASNRVEGSYIRVVIDSGNYRERRQQTLEKLASKISASVVKSGRSVTLEPMNPYERRIIHSTVGNIEGVKSTSVGDEPNRRVIISLADGASPQIKRRFQGSNDRRGGKRPYGNKPRANSEGNSEAPRRFSGSNSQISRKPQGESSENQGSERPQRQGGRGGFNKKPRTAPAAPIVENPNREKPTEAANTPIYGKIDL